MVEWPPPWPWFLCLIVIVLVAVTSFILILRTEGKRPPQPDRPVSIAPSQTNQFVKERQSLQAKGWDGIPVTLVFKQELWQACYATIHPGWLLAYRFFFFVYFTGVFIHLQLRSSLHNLLFFTQWNFLMLTAYFALGSWIGFSACFLDRERASPYEKRGESGLGELAQGTVTQGTVDESEQLLAEQSRRSFLRKKSVKGEEAGPLGYTMQAFYQISLPMALLVDAVLWGVLYPETVRNHTQYTVLNFSSYNQHGVNLVACIGDFALNSMRYPWFRSAYVLLWGTTYVLVQWFFHDVLGHYWPYFFMRNDVPEAPLWYLGLLGFLLACFWLWRVAHRARLWLFPNSPEWLAYLQQKSDILYDIPPAADSISNPV